MEDKPLTRAEEYSKHLRRQFPTLFPRDLGVVLRILTQSQRDYEWKSGPVIYPDTRLLVDKEPSTEPYDVTEEGWRSFKLRHNSHPPTSWQDPHPGSALFNIPDDADEGWLDFIYDELSSLLRWDIDQMTTWIGTYQMLQGIGAEYRDNYIRIYTQAYLKTRTAAGEIRRRINFIRLTRDRIKNPAPRKIEAGSLVRPKTGHLPSKVMEIDKVVGGAFGLMARIDPPQTTAPGQREYSWWALSELVLMEEEAKPEIPTNDTRTTA